MRAGQRGSILIAVLAFSLILTAAAAAYLALGANSGGANADTRRLSRIYLAAESGLNLGVRWCKYYPVTKFNNDLTRSWADGLILTRDTIAGAGGWADFDGTQVKVVFKQGALTGPGYHGFHELVSYATAGRHTDTVKLAIQFGGAYSGAPVSKFDTWLTSWTDSLLPGK